MTQEDLSNTDGAFINEGNDAAYSGDCLADTDIYHLPTYTYYNDATLRLGTMPSMMHKLRRAFQRSLPQSHLLLPRFLMSDAAVTGSRTPQ
jgi:hypothetical protein